MSVKPIRPSEVSLKKAESIPDAVFKSFNKLIVDNFSNGVAVVGQNEVVELLVKAGFKRGEIFDRDWLDIESKYRLAGWIVTYDKPAFNECYEATFKFKKRSSDTR